MNEISNDGSKKEARTSRDQTTGAFGLRVCLVMGSEGKKVFWLNTYLCLAPDLASVQVVVEVMQKRSLLV